VPRGSFARVASELAAQGIVANQEFGPCMPRFKGLAPAVKRGEYEIQPGTTAARAC